MHIHIHMHTHTYTNLTVYRLHMNYRCYEILLRGKYLYTNLARCDGYLSLGRRPGGDWANT